MNELTLENRLRLIKSLSELKEHDTITKNITVLIREIFLDSFDGMVFKVIWIDADHFELRPANSEDDGQSPT